MKVLYVEDDSRDALLAQHELARHAPYILLEIKHTLSDARTQLAETQDYDLVLSDLNLPDGNGLELLSEIREQALPLAVVILTGQGDEEIAVAALKAGADDYLAKRPGYLARLPMVLDAALSRFRAEVARKSGKLRVLYAEHNTADIDFTRRHLESHAPHIRLEIVYNAREALQRLPETAGLAPPCDVLLLDYHLPGESALEVLKILHDERHLDLPVVLVTGQGDEEVAAQALRLGASDYLVKHPNYLYELPAALENVYHRARLVREQAALRESEARFRLLAENAQDVIYRIRLIPEFSYEYVSPAVTTMTGYTPEEHYADPDLRFKMVHSDDRPLLETLNRGELPLDRPIALRWVRKDGRVVWVEQRNVPIFDEAGDLVALEGIARDITEHKHAEDALRYQAQLLENVSDAIISTDLSFNIESWNPAAAVIYGWSDQEAIGRPISEVVPTEIPDTRLEDTIQQLMTQGSWQGEVIQQRRDGMKLYMLSSVSLIRDPAGNPTGAVAVNRDITESKEVDAQLQLQSAALNAAANAIVITDKADKIEWCNPAFPALTGYTTAEVIGKDLSTLIRSGVHDDAFYQDLWDTTRTGKVWRGEIVNRRKDGSLLNEEVTITPLLDEFGEISHNITIQQDITPRKQAEEHIRQQLRRLAALRTIDTAITSSFDLRLTLSIALREAISELNVDSASILLFNSHSQILEYAAGSGFRTDSLQNTQLRLGESFAGQSVLERRIISVPDLRGRSTAFLRSPNFSNEGFIAYFAVPLTAKGEVKGVMEIFHRSPLTPEPGWLNFLETLAGQVAIAIDNSQLFDGLQKANLELALAYDATIEGWSRALDLRDKETEGHSLRVTEMTLRLAKGAGLDSEDLVHIRRGALLHDIGKMGIPDTILLKATSLTEEEWVMMRLHPVFAYEMLSPITYLRPALDIPYCHHEKWDGSGYPRRLKGEQIPLAARLFAVVDVWDAVTSDRPYRAAWSQEKALKYILEQRGIHFDPWAVDMFNHSREDRELKRL